MMPDFAFVGTYVEGSAVNLLARINQSHGNTYLIGHELSPDPTCKNIVSENSGLGSSRLPLDDSSRSTVDREHDVACNVERSLTFWDTEEIMALLKGMAYVKRERQCQKKCC